MVDNRIQKPGLVLLAALLLLIGTSGCQSIRKPTVFSRLGPKAAEKVKYEQPHRMAVIWKDTSMPTVPGKKSTRGFGGRVYFYNGADEPVRVDGDLIVYAFDDSKAKALAEIDKTRNPDRKYVFRATELQQHFSQTGIGASYSVWIPWDEVGGDQASIALLPMFKPTNGQIVNAGQSIAVLPGKNSDISSIAINSASVNEVRRASAELPDEFGYGADAIGIREENARRRRTTTIDLPRNLSRQMQNLPAQPTQSGMTERDAGSAFAPSSTGAKDSAGMTELDQQLYQRVTDDSTRELNSGRSKRQPVFGSPGPFR